jgi:hypothetical protein
MRLNLILAGLALAALTGCGSPTVYGVYYNSGYTPDHPQLAAADGTALAIIRANPFPEDRDNATILADMQGRNPGYKLYFSQTARPESKYDYKVILTFGRTGGGGVNPCLDTSPLPPASNNGQVDVRADFCVGTNLLSEARGSVDGVQQASDPRVNRLLGDVLSSLLSDRYEDRANRCGTGDC